ncbi:hypothetical protein H7S36_24060 [Priestia aryabhattai]|nr:YheC/YheD family protein [Priestia aryabhattai]MBX9988371.1 hypothetical protein [Priestia aryabhattai]
MKAKRFESYQKSQDWTLPRLILGSYILQQGIETVKSSKNAIDIRINMNQNSKGQREIPIILFQVASNSSHVILKLLTAYSVSNFIKTLTVDKEKEEKIEKSVMNVGMKVYSMLDNSEYHMVDFGINLGMGKNGRVRLFEINPPPISFRGSIQNHFLIRPIEYASYLALNKQPQQASQPEVDKKCWKF